MYYLGIDIGGTFIKYALIHKNMKVIKKWKKETQKYETVEAFYDYLCADIYNLNEIELIGVSAPGVIDETSQVMSEAAKNVRIMYKTYVNQEIEKRLHKPTATINDAKARMVRISISSPLKSSSVSSAVGISAAFPLVNKALEASLAFSASASPCTRFVSSKARISFAVFNWLPSHLSISLICSIGRNVSILRHFSTSASAIFLQYW